jgi:hypothetical protein
MSKPLKVGLKIGGGPPPGFLWNVAFLSLAADDAASFLTDEQYEHAKDLVRALAMEERPTHAVTVSVDQIEDFYELRDKGGVLGRINLRIFFTLMAKEKTILILAVVKKEADGQTPPRMKILVRYRLRRFRGGEFGGLM